MCKLHYVIDAADRIFIENQFVETVCVYRFKGIVQPFELGGVTRLIRSEVKFCMAGNLK